MAILFFLCFQEDFQGFAKKIFFSDNSLTIEIQIGTLIVGNKNNNDEKILQTHIKGIGSIGPGPFLNSLCLGKLGKTIPG